METRLIIPRVGMGWVRESMFTMGSSNGCNINTNSRWC